MKIKNLLKLLLITVLLFTVVLCASCGKDGEAEPETTEDDSSAIDTEGKYSIFANGEYCVKVVIPANATEAEKSMYNDLRNKLRQITDVDFEAVTDFKAYNDDGVARKEPAILIGNTNYDESKEVYDTLGYAQSKLEIIGNKMVLAFSSQEDANRLYIKLVAALRDSTKEYVGVDGTLEIFEISNEFLASLPQYTASTHELVELERSTYMIYAKKATAEQVEGYSQKLVENGFSPVGEVRRVGDNSFKTLANDEKYVYIYHRANDNSLRIVLGPKRMLASADCGAGLEEKYEPSLTMIEQPDGTTVGQGYIFLLPDGRLLVQDGGCNSKDNTDYIYEAMKAVAPDPDNIVVAAWFVSHPHEDHQFGYEEFLSNHSKEDITLERLVFNYGPSSLYTYKRNDGVQEGSAQFVERIYTLTAEKFPKAQIVKAHTGQVMSFGSVDIEILFTVEDLMPTAEFDFVNSTSMVIRIFCEDQSILLLADTTHKSGRIIEDMYGDHLKSTMVQLAHHGMAPSNATLYDKIQAEVLIWPSTYVYATENYKTYQSTIDKALLYAKDVYMADFEDGYLLTLKLPYTAANNKDAFLALISPPQDENS